MRKEEYFIVEDLFPDFKILSERHVDKTAQDLKKIREQNILNKRLINHGMPMTYEEETGIVGDYDNEVQLAELESYFQRSLQSIIKILESKGIQIPKNEISIAYVEVKERRHREGIEAKIYEPKLFKLDSLEDFKNWHPVYGMILEELLRIKEITSRKELEESLTLMSIFDRDLHQSYQNNQIDLSYDEEGRQLAYLLRYSSVYINDLVKILSELEVKKFLFNSDNLRLSFVGVGPGFESMTFLDWMIEENALSNKTSLELNLIDKDEWKIGRNIIKNKIQEILPLKGLENRILLKESHTDFMDINEKELAGDLLIFQNCLNEILTTHKTENVQSKVQSILSLMPIKSYLIFIDRDKYDSIDSFFKNLSSVVSSTSKFKVLKEGSPGRIQHITLDQIPDILKETIYDGGINPSRNTSSTYFAVQVVQ